jgi:Tol biopolymer transport system component
MRDRLRILLLIAILLCLSAILIYLLGTPRLLGVSPVDGEAAVSPGTSLTLTFSRPMQADTVIERLDIQPSVAGNYAWDGNRLVFTPLQPWQAGETIRVMLTGGSRAAGWLGLPIRGDVAWSFTIRQLRLIYLYPSDSAANIYALEPYSGVNTPLTNHPGGVQDFQVDFSGTAIYYSVRNAGAGSNIYRLKIPTSQPGDAPEATNQETPRTATPPEPELILSCSQAICRSPAVSPDGRYLAYEHIALPGSNEPNYPQVRLLSLEAQSFPVNDASPDPVLAGNPLHQTLQPTWSSQGILALYDTNAGAYIFLEPQDGELARLPNQTGQSGAWDPQGRYFLAAEIFFLDENFSKELTNLEPLANSHLLLFDWQQDTVQDLTPEETMEDTSPAFSPDGKTLAFARKYLDITRWTPGRQLWLEHLDSHEESPLTDEPLYNHFEFTWSPDGNRLAYVRFNQSVLTEPPEIWLIDPVTKQAEQLVVGGYSPQWIP